MINKIPFDWKDPTQTAIIDAYKLDGTEDFNYFSGYSGYFSAGFQFYSRNISGVSGMSDLRGYHLEVSPAGNEPAYWVSGILENKDNHYSTFVESVTNNPKYIF
jgi:hypothetical protein